MGRKAIEFDLDKVQELASRGLTQAEIAEYFGVSTDTISANMKYNGFSNAVKTGRAQGISDVATALYEKAIGGETAAMIFYLRARANWVEPQRIKQELIQADKKPSRMTDAELNAAIAGYLIEGGLEEPEKHVNDFIDFLAAGEKARIEAVLRAEF